jgi:dihydropteroate synthase
MTSLHIRPVQFVDGPIGHDGNVARLAGGMQWFAAYEVIEADRRRTVSIADFERSLGASDERAALLHARITAPRPPLTLGARTLRFDQPVIAGILNVTPDSFSDGGALHDNPQAASATGVDMTMQGAAIIDLGGESTRPGAALVWEGDEVKRVVPVAERLVRAGALVSVDTRKAAVMEAALGVGAQIINDISALLWDDRSLGVVATSGAPAVLMHSPDPARGPHGGKGNGNGLVDVFDWLEARIAAVVAGGVDRARIIVDPGIGFGKSLADNLTLINGLALFHGLGCPIMLGASRKRMIGVLSNEAPVAERLGGSVALALKGAEMGAQILRVHDVFASTQAIRVWRGLRDQALVGG